MKFIKQIIMTILLMVVPVSGFAFQNEPNGFRDLYWGESLAEIQEKRSAGYLMYRERTNSVSYVVRLNANESQALSGVPILMGGIMVSLWNNQLWEIQLYFDGEDSFYSLKKAMILLYGYPTHNKENSCAWVGDKAMLELEKFDGEKRGSRVSMASTEIFIDIRKDEAKKGW